MKGHSLSLRRRERGTFNNIRRPEGRVINRLRDDGRIRGKDVIHRMSFIGWGRA